MNETSTRPPRIEPARAGRLRGVLAHVLRESGRVMAVVWILCGVLVCSETLPDVIGHAHLHSQGHTLAPWHGEWEEGTSRQPSPKDHFHYHVVLDFSSLETAVSVSTTPELADPGMLSRVRHECEAVPEGPCLESLDPPLI